MRPIIPQMPQKFSAQIVCPIKKVLDFDEKRLHWTSVVRALPVWSVVYQIMSSSLNQTHWFFRLFSCNFAWKAKRSIQLQHRQNHFHTRREINLNLICAKVHILVFQLSIQIQIRWISRLRFNRSRLKRVKDRFFSF